MRIEDVKVGDVVIPRQFQGKYLLPGGRHIRWTESEKRQFVGAKATVVRVDSDTSVKIKLPDGQVYWWPAEHCDLVRTSLALPAKHALPVPGRCAGEHIAREMARLVLERFRIEVVSADLRKVGLITQRLRRVTCVITRR